MGERVFVTTFAMVVALLLACSELVELFEPKAPAPEWRYRTYRAALRLTARRLR